MDMSPEVIGIVTAGTGLAALFVGLFAWLRQDIKEQGKEIKEQGQELRKEINEQGQKHSNELTEVKVEVAALKATVETYFRVRVDPPQQTAVADDPEEYGSN